MILLAVTYCLAAKTSGLLGPMYAKFPNLDHILPDCTICPPEKSIEHMTKSCGIKVLQLPWENNQNSC